MRIGICTNMLAAPGDPLGVRVLEAADALGFAYLELPGAQLMDLGDAAFEELLGRVEKLRMRCEFVNSMFPASLRLTGSAVSDAAVDAYLDRLFPRLAALGAKVVVFGSAGARNVPDGFSREEAFAQLAGMLGRAADRARGCGVTVAIETLNRGETNILLSLAESAALMRAVNRPEVRMLVDYYHHAIEEEAESEIVALGADIVHAHLAEPKGRVMPFRAKEEYVAFFRSLRAAGYDGGVSVESYSQNPVEEMRVALAILRAAEEESK